MIGRNWRNVKEGQGISTDRKLLFSRTIEMVHGFLVDVNVRILECLANVSGSNRGNL